MTSSFTPLDHPGAWKAAERDKSSFTVELDERMLSAFDAALRTAKEKDCDCQSITREDFPLTDIAAELQAWRDQVRDGEGIVILKGFPLQQYFSDDMEMIYFGLGSHFGTAMSQSVMGDKLGHVVDVGGKDPRERAYRNSTELDMHTDACDIVAMLCLQKASKGGFSGYVSAISIYNEVLRRRADLMPILMRGFYYHRFGEEAPGESPITEERVPVFSFTDGYLSINYLRSYIEMAAEEMQQAFSENERAALNLIDEIAHDPGFALKFITQPGEAVFFNNQTMLHNRTAFEDSEEPELKRHFMRLWLVSHDPRPVCDSLRIYEGRGIEAQQGRGTYFEGDLNYSRFEDDKARM